MFLAARVGDPWAYFRENADPKTWVPLRGILEAGRHWEAFEACGTAVLLLTLGHGLIWLWRTGHEDTLFVAA